MLQIKELQTFSVRGQILNILSFPGSMVSVVATQLWHRNAQTPRGTVEGIGRGYFNKI